MILWKIVLRLRLVDDQKKKASHLYQKNCENKSFKIPHIWREKKVEIFIFRL
jgi:hypothetical protein